MALPRVFADGGPVGELPAGGPNWWAAALFLASSGLLGRALQISNGTYDPGNPQSLAWLGAAIGLSLAAVAFYPELARRGGGSRAATVVASLVLAANFIQLFASGPGFQSVNAAGAFVVALLGIGLLATVAGLTWKRIGPVVAAMALLVAAGVSIWATRQAPDPPIDVFLSTQIACKELPHGVSPYANSFPLIYSAPAAAIYYPPGTVWAGVVHFGYNYAPLTFLISQIGYLASGDYRLAMGLSLVVGVIGLAWAGGSRFSFLVAMALLTTPRAFFVLNQGWVEPAMVLMLGFAAVAGMRRIGGARSNWLAHAAGLLMVSKQSMVVALPAALLLLPRPMTRRWVCGFVVRAVAAGLVVSLPLVLMAPRAFWRSAVQIPLAMPARLDSMNFAYIWVQQMGRPAPQIIGVGLVIAAALLGWWRLPRGFGSFAGAAALSFLGFFAFAHQAFCNYYFFVIALLCAGAIGVTQPTGVSRQGQAQRARVP
jgi:hypothetical protein